MTADLWATQALATSAARFSDDPLATRRRFESERPRHTFHHESHNMAIPAFLCRSALI